MNIIEKHQIKHFHSSRFSEKQDNHVFSQGWTSTAVQQKRFGAIVELIDFNDVSILDLGCGCGDFKKVLDERFHRFDYIGLDQQEEFIKYAQKHFQHQRHTWFHQVDFTRCELPQVDIIVASGALSYKSDNPNYYVEMIEKFYASANFAFVFNMLDQDHFESGPLIVSHNKDEIYEQCQKLCKHTSLKTGYLDNDFTIVMRKK